MIDFKTAEAVSATIIMSSNIRDYVSSFALKTVVLYQHADSSPVASRKGEIIMNVDTLGSCPSIVDLSRAIEKRVNRSDSLKVYSNIIPLCMMLLSSNGYSIHAVVFDNVPNLLIERCWECLETISHATNNALQKWLSDSIGSRSPVGFATLFTPHRSSSGLITNIPVALPKSMKFSLLDSSKVDVPSQMWHRDDVTNRTRLVHINASLRDISHNSQ